MPIRCCVIAVLARTKQPKPPPLRPCRKFRTAPAAAYRLGNQHRMTLTHVAKCKTREVVAMPAAQDNQQQVPPLVMSHRVAPTGEVIADIVGELDIATAETAVSYLTDIIDHHHHGPVIVNLTGLRFCDARGLSALLRMANHAEQAGCPFMLASPSPPLIKLMRITGLDRRLLPSG
jgi:anti-anti-sigma factor